MAKKNRQEPQQKRAMQERPPSPRMNQDRSQCLTESLLWFSVLFIFSSVTFMTVFYLESKSPGKSPQFNNSTFQDNSNIDGMSDIPTINLVQVECGSNCLIPAWPSIDYGCHDDHIAIKLCAEKTKMEGLALTLYKCAQGQSQCIMYQKKKKADPLTCNIHPFQQVEKCTQQVENGSFFILQDKHLKRFPDFFAS